MGQDVEQFSRVDGAVFVTPETFEDLERLWGCAKRRCDVAAEACEA
ncbi:MAG: hypothetical protein ACKVPX_09360 [Myxococcaceae bacterium]